jgi:hypothetical protein
MKTQIARILTGFGALITAALTAQAQYSWITLDDPMAGNASGHGTTPTDVSGTNIVGYYYLDSGYVGHGFIYDGRTWTTLDAPASGSGAGTFVGGISGCSICGSYYDSQNTSHGFLYNLCQNTWTFLDDPGAGVGGANTYFGTRPFDMSGDTIVGEYDDSRGVEHGFLYNTVSSNWTTFNDPAADSAPGQGTYPWGISDSIVTGFYTDVYGASHAFIYNIAQDGWTNLNALGAGAAANQGTSFTHLSGNNITGNVIDANGVEYGLLYNLVSSNWMAFDDPSAGSASGQGSTPIGIDGATVVGGYTDSNGVLHGFLATPIPQLTITQSGNSLNISWPYWNNPSTGWILQQNSDLTTTNWTPAPTGGISNDGTNNFITITPSAGNLFFRLSHQ